MTGEAELSRADAQYVSDMLDRSIALHERGEWRPAIRAAADVLDRLRRSGAHEAQADSFAATAHQLSAAGLGELGLIDRAVEHYHLAEALLVPHAEPECREQLTQLVFNLAVLLNDNGMTDAARATLERNHEYARDVDGPYLDMSMAMAQGLAWADADDPSAGGLEDVEEVRRRVHAATPSADWATDAANLAGRLLERASADDVAEAEGLLCHALAWARSAGRWTAYARMFGLFRHALEHPVALGPQTVAEVTQALGLLRHIPNPTDRGVVCETAAVLLSTQAVLAPLRPRALPLSLHAIAYHDSAAIAIRATLLRGLLNSATGDVARSVALSIAADSGDRELFVELLESSRLQVRPVERGDDSGALAGMGSVGLSPIQPIAVGAASRLRPYYPSGTAEPVDADLFEIIDAVGGPGSWWWSANVIDARYFWAVIAPDRTIEVGYRDLDDAEFTSVADSAIDAVSGAREVDIATAPSRPMTWLYASSDAEQQRSLALGGLLIPPPLHAALWGGAHDRPTPSLVVAGAVLAALPQRPAGGPRRPGPGAPAAGAGGHPLGRHGTDRPSGGRPSAVFRRTLPGRRRLPGPRRRPRLCRGEHRSVRGDAAAFVATAAAPGPTRARRYRRRSHDRPAVPRCVRSRRLPLQRALVARRRRYRCGTGPAGRCADGRRHALRRPRSPTGPATEPRPVVVVQLRRRDGQRPRRVARPEHRLPARRRA
jgi:hypothetical protein